MKFYKEVEKRYGSRKKTLLKDYAKTIKKLAQNETSKGFLIKCRKRSLIPKFISSSSKTIKKLLNSNSKYIQKFDNIIYNFQKRLLNVLIDDKCHTSRITHTKLYTLQEQIINTLPYHISHEFLTQQNEYYTNTEAKITQTLEKKFEVLHNTHIQSLNLFKNNNTFLNLTNLIVPDSIQWLLGLGKKFAINNHGEFPLFQIIADVEEIVNTLNDDHTKNVLRARIANMIANTQKQYKHNTNTIHNTITHIYNECITFLNTNKDIIVVESDKTKCTVMMYASEYNKKVKELLRDNNTYKIIEKGDPTNKLQTINNKYIIDLFKSSFIDVNLKNSLTIYNASAPKLYALPKTHKENIPMRPVVASINTPSSKLSKYLSSILKNLLTNDRFNVTNSYEFKEKVSSITLNDEDQMVSFDIVSLFTNIPINLSIDIIMDRWNELNNFTNLPRKTFFTLLRFCLIDANYFVYGSIYYQQIYGMPMGNSLSSVIADVITQKLLTTALNSLSSQPKMLVKYVDDVFCIVTKNNINETLNALNSFHCKLQFTLELENNNSLAYLDVLVVRNSDGKLNTDWFRKSTSSDRLLNYYSNHPEKQKINTAYNFVNRVLGLSSECYHKKNIQKIYHTLKNNNYPNKIIKSTINSWIQKTTLPLHTTENNTHTNTEHKTYKSLTYINGLSEKINKITRTYTDKIQIAHKSNVCIQNIFTKLKEKTPTNRQTNVIYKIPCLGTGEPGSNCKLTYVGQTKQFLEKRIKNHINDIKKPYLSHVPNTAVVQHFHDVGHYPDFKNTKILDTQKPYRKRLTIESLHIYTQNTYNQRRDVENISAIFCAIIDDNKQNKKRKREETGHPNTNPHKRRRVII